MTSPAAALRPIFVIGSPRSGTTLLRYMLCSHPRLFIPPESNFVPRLFGRDPHRPLSTAEAVRILRAIGEYRLFWKDWVGVRPEPEQLLADLPDPVSPAALLDAVYARYAAQQGATRWGDKSPVYAAHVPLLDALFPSCQVVHIVRDGRDVVASSLEAYGGQRFFYMDAYYASRTWRDLVGGAVRAGRRLGPERYHEIRYEDLTADPEGALRSLCAFLDEAYDPAMAQPGDEARRHHHSTGIHRNVRAPVTGARAGRWQLDLTPPDQRIVQAATGPLLVRLGYPLADVGSPAARERGRAIALRGKYVVMDRGRRVLRSMGVSHPTRLVASLPRRRPDPAAAPTLPTEAA